MKEPSTTESGPIRIDVGAVIEARAGKGRVPGWVVRALARLIRQDELNHLLAEAYPARGSGFCSRVLDILGIRLQVDGSANLPESPRAVFISNHPLGGLDGMALISMIAARYGVEPLFVVNDLLMAVEPLTDVFLPVNKHGSQGRAAAIGIDEAMAGDRPVIIFPAGLCSRRRGGKVADLEWRKMFALKARQFRRDVVPMHFCSRNTDAFYRWAALRERLGIKLNIEMALLPGQIFKKKGATFHIAVGKPVPWQELGSDAAAATRRLRGICDALAPDSNSSQN